MEPKNSMSNLLQSSVKPTNAKLAMSEKEQCLAGRQSTALIRLGWSSIQLGPLDRHTTEPRIFFAPIKYSHAVFSHNLSVDPGLRLSWWRAATANMDRRSKWVIVWEGSSCGEDEVRLASGVVGLLLQTSWTGNTLERALRIPPLFPNYAHSQKKTYTWRKAHRSLHSLKNRPLWITGNIGWA